jgi:3-oxoadipate enol-lactonase
MRRSHRVLRVDLRGHGASPVPSGPYTLEQLAADVLRAADAAGLSRFHYCGVSLGGMVGLCLAARHPARVASLVAANTAARIGTQEGWDERCAAVEASGLDGMCDAVLARWFAPGFAGREPERFARARRVFASTSAEGYVACCRALSSADFTAELPRIAAPTLVIGGDLDVSTPAAEAHALHANIRRSRLMILAGAAHLSHLDSSEYFNAAVAAFVLEHGVTEPQ